MPLDPAFEHAVYVLSGDVTVDGAALEPDVLLYLGTGRDRLDLKTGGAAKFIVLGGAPFGERIVMWWNFIGRSHEEVVGFREEWQRARDESGESGETAYGVFPEEWDHTLPAPGLPNLRLRSRG